MATKRKDASKYLGGMSGKAAHMMRTRGSQLDAAMHSAMGTGPRKPAVKNKKKK